MHLDDFIRAVPLLRDTLPPAQLAALARECESVTVEPGSLLLVTLLGAPPYVWLEKGVAALVRMPGGTPLALYGPACWLPLPSLSPTLAVRALTRASCVLLPAGAARRAARQSPLLSLRLLDALAQQQQPLLTHLSTLQNASAPQRVAYLLLRLSREFQLGNPLRLPATQPLLAQLLGISREAFSRALRHLARQGVIEVRGGSISIVDGQGLEGYESEYRVGGRASDK